MDGGRKQKKKLTLNGFIQLILKSLWKQTEIDFKRHSLNPFLRLTCAPSEEGARAHPRLASVNNDFLNQDLDYVSFSPIMIRSPSDSVGQENAATL